MIVDLLDSERLEVTLKRLAYQLQEEYPTLPKLTLIGLQPRGVIVATKIIQKLEEVTGSNSFYQGVLDPTFHRDDFRRGSQPLLPKGVKMNIPVEGQHVVLIDDVLYTARTVRAALDSLYDYGRPATVKLMVLVDRRYSRHVPIQPDYTGIAVDTHEGNKVQLVWDNQGNGVVRLLSREGTA